MEKNIYLIGPRASGKTSVGREVARRLGRTFVDSDDLVVDAIGMPIADYVAKRGWEAFRDAEEAVMEEVGHREDMVVACGGGVVMRARNRQILGRGTVVYLKVKPEILAARLSRDPQEGKRPSLTGKSIDEEVRQVLAERQSLYLSCANVVVRDRESMDDEVEQILKEIKQFQ